MKRVLAALLLGVLLLAGCTGVPSSSAPETVQAPVTEPGSAPPTAPVNLDGDPRTIVESFLAASATTPATGYPSAALPYLTPAARTHWPYETAPVTIIADDYTVSTYDPQRHSVTVSGRQIGTLSTTNPTGIYSPNAVGERPFVFTIARVHGQYRIANLPPGVGLLLSDAQFRSNFQQHVLYFDTVAQDALIPDLRWSGLEDRAQLAEWLIGQLAQGPRQSLQNAVSLDTLPAQLDPRQVVVTLGNPTVIAIPGSSQLDSGARDRLAAQLSETLFEPLAGRDITITDGPRQVVIPSVGGAVFNASEFANVTGPQPPTTAVYYLNDGHIRDETGRLLPIAGNGSGYLSSFAISSTGADTPLLIAGVTGSGSAQRLQVGTQRSGLRSTSVVGALSRPAFVPGRPEVWIGDGSKVYRVNVDGGVPHAQLVEVPSSLNGGRVVALRLSPEGYRLAMVVSGANGAAQLWIGSIVRGAGPVRVDRADLISPAVAVVQDVAWLDSVRLFGIDHLAGSDSWRTFETGVDGTEWTEEGLGNLPSHPDTVAGATGANVWVSAGSPDSFVWKQIGNSWVSPGPTGQTPGSAPVYLE